ncbi:MAG: protoglobin domain-containing protein [Bryobacteraceae bacterium]
MTGNERTRIPGYDYGRETVSDSTVTMDELQQLEQTVGWTDEDASWLRVAAETLVPQSEQIVDAWRAAIARQPHLSAWFLKTDGTPDEAYKAAVKRRFVQWISDLCLRPHDHDWLNYQEEIGLRHTPVKKNQTDRGQTPPLVPLRYTIAFASVVITSIRPFLDSSGKSEHDLQSIQAAWARAVLLSIALWSRPYTSPGLW